MAFDYPSISLEERGVVGLAYRDEVAKLTTLWEEVESRLTAIAHDSELIALAQGGSSNASAARHRQAVLMAQTREALEDLRLNTMRWAGEAVPAQATAGTAAVVESAAAQGAMFGAVLGAANVDAMALLIEDILIDTEHAIVSAEHTMRRHFRLTQQRLLTEAQINQALAISEARLENLDQRALRLQREFAAATRQGNFILINGRRWGLEPYARVVASTRLAEAANEAAFATIQSMGQDLVRISDHGKTEPACDRHAGKVYSISGRDKRFPVLRERPPYHPHCRHIIQPFIVDLKSENELRYAIARSHDKIEPGISIGEFLALP